jgi:hypothetical protein
MPVFFIGANMDYQTYLASIGTAPAAIKRMVETRAQHTFGEPVEEYNPASEDDAEGAVED